MPRLLSPILFTTTGRGPEGLQLNRLLEADTASLSPKGLPIPF